jgi:hypothetical protein
MIDKVFAILGLLLSVLAMGLVAGWASQDGGEKDPYGWLSKPNWGAEGGGGVAKLSWHPVLMVGGFFLSQVHVVAVWTFAPEAASTVRKFFLWFFRFAALACFVGAMCAVVNFKLQNKMDALISMHSWIGVCAFIAFGCSFCWGFVADFVGSIAKQWEVNYDVEYLHKFMSIAALALTCTAVCSGIVNYLGQGKCDFISGTDSTQENPAYYYAHYPNSCKIAYGCGLAVVGATMTALVGITYSAFNPQSYKKVELSE